jgi:sec-independent protein translocase protein TatA
MGNLGATEILLILLVVLLLFGAKRIPEMARGLGKGIREFKDATNDIKREITLSDAPPPALPPQAQVPYTPPQTHTAPPVQPPVTPPPSTAGEAPPQG